MKAIVCEMCGSQDLIKKDGMYVCQNCGTKYDPEEAKKLMIDITVDNSKKVDNWYQLARQAKSNNDAESAAKYYELILQEEPKSWEAMFYSVYFRAMQTKIAYIANAARMVRNTFPSVFSSIKETIDDPLLQIKAASEIYLYVKALGLALESSARKTYKENLDSFDGIGADGSIFEKYHNEYFDRFSEIATMFERVGDSLEQYFPNDASMYQLAVDAWKTELQYYSDYHYLLDSDYSTNRGKLDLLCSKIRKIEPNYTIPESNLNGFPNFVVYRSNQLKKPSGGCYVATAVYGSYDCPQVWTLRRYRDDTLAETWLGRLFILLYYAISPTLVKWFGETQWFKNLWKPRLDKMIKRLNDEGVENTPYQDRQW